MTRIEKFIRKITRIKNDNSSNDEVSLILENGGRRGKPRNGVKCESERERERRRLDRNLEDEGSEEFVTRECREKLSTLIYGPRISFCRFLRTESVSVGLILI